MKKFIKSLTVVVSVAVLAFGLAACSSSSDDDNNGSSNSTSNGNENGGGGTTSGLTLPKSVGANDLAGKTYLKTDSFSDDYEKRVFTEDKITVTEKEDGEEKVSGYVYTYDSEKGILYAKIDYMKIENEVCHNMAELKAAYTKLGGFYALIALMMDTMPDVFAEMHTFNYYIKDDGNAIFADYFNGKLTSNKFYYKDGELQIRINKDGIKFWGNTTGGDYNTEVNDETKKIEGDGVVGSWETVVKPSKTLKEIIASDPTYNGDLNEANGYVEITFSDLPSRIVDFETGKPYKFIFSILANEFIKQ